MKLCENCPVPVLDGYGIEHGDKVALTQPYEITI